MKQNPKKTVALAVWIVSLAASGDIPYVREDELVLSERLLRSCGTEQAIDLRPCWTSVEDMSWIPLSYSSVGWGLEDLPGESTVRLDNVTGEVFAVRQGLTGRGVVHWAVRDNDSKVLCIRHCVTREGVAVPQETLFAHFDLTAFVEQDRQLKAAVLGCSQSVRCENDPCRPWSFLGGAGEGVANAQDGAQFSFSFVGAGVFSVELAFESGSVAVTLDGVAVETVTAGAQWARYAWPVESFGSHKVTVRYSGASEVRMRNAMMTGCDCRIRPASRASSALDLRKGVRRVRRYSEILPFAYSSTNWVGDVIGVDASSVAKVTIVQLTGTDPDVGNWTETVPGTLEELVAKPGEGQVRWRPKQGVWKATFDILNDGHEAHRETAIFDLRNASGVGFVFIIR